MIPPPELQIAFSVALAEIRRQMLQEALRETVRKLDIPALDQELADNVPLHSLAQLASFGIRGEMMFPVPLVLTANPRLLGYYRLLYGYSQKEFYGSTMGLGKFNSMEAKGVLRSELTHSLPKFCKEMCEAGAHLLTGIAGQQVTAGLLDDLTLLTLGPQWRGGANVRRGIAGIVQVFNTIKEIVQDYVETSDHRELKVRNAAGRLVLIQFAADPDIVIREELRPETYRNIVAIEVKGGTDFSNIHNRIGEAEKSHQKARALGYAECWTIVNVDRIDLGMAARESPTSNRFYRISSLVEAVGQEFEDFEDRVISMTGIPTPH